VNRPHIRSYIVLIVAVLSRARQDSATVYPVTKAPSTAHPTTNPLPRLNQTTPHHQTFQNPWREFHSRAKRLDTAGRRRSIV